MEQWQLFFMITGVLFWGYWLVRWVDLICLWNAKRRGEVYYDIKGTKHNFAPLKDWTMGMTINEIDATPVTVEPCDKCKPKKKWERLNAKDDTADDI